LTGFAVVAQSDLDTFVPFNSSTPNSTGGQSKARCVLADHSFAIDLLVVGATPPQKDFAMGSYVTCVFVLTLGVNSNLNDPPQSRLQRRRGWGSRIPGELNKSLISLS
jgi:hypothetical protein